MSTPLRNERRSKTSALEKIQSIYSNKFKNNKTNKNNTTVRFEQSRSAEINKNNKIVRFGEGSETINNF